MPLPSAWSVTPATSSDRTVFSESCSSTSTKRLSVVVASRLNDQQEETDHCGNFHVRKMFAI